MNVGILAAATGNGHISVARAIEERLIEKGARVFTYERFYEELMPSNKIMSDYYNFLMQSSTELCCKFSELSYLTRPDLSEDFYRGSRDAIVRFLRERPYDVLVSTSHTINHAVLRAIQELHMDRPPEYYIVVTDPFVPISVGFDVKGADQYYCTGGEVSALLQKRGIEPSLITETAYPVQSKFLRNYTPEDLHQLRLGAGLTEDRKVLMINSGSQGAYHYLQILKTALKQFPELQILFVSGKNETLYTMACRIAEAADHRVKVIGYAEHIEQFIQIANIIITKPGANAFFESVYARKPMLLDAVNGFLFQEKGVMTWLDQYPLGSVLTGLDDLPAQLNEILLNLERMDHTSGPHAGRQAGALAIADDIWVRYKHSKERVGAHDY